MNERAKRYRQILEDLRANKIRAIEYANPSADADLITYVFVYYDGRVLRHSANLSEVTACWKAIAALDERHPIRVRIARDVELAAIELVRYAWPNRPGL